MKLKPIKTIVLAAALVAAGSINTLAQTSELDELKAKMKAMEQTMEEMKQKIAELEKQKAAAPAPVPTRASVLESNSPSMQTLEKVAEGETVARQSPVTYRGAFNDQQTPASRPNDYTLDPTLQGFIPVPNTPVLVKFNAKPRLDVTVDNMNSGDNYRFVPAKFPLQGSPTFGGGEQAFVNANASQLSFDVRAPEMPGDFRFYYQNDFFGSDTSNMKYRLQQLWGEIYNFKAGFTYSVWEDPDVWPDTVDYEGPNAVIFARRPVAQYTVAWNDNWNTTFGVEQPDYHVDVPPNGSTLTAMPDLGFNTRWEKAGVGNVQFSALFRDIGARNQFGQAQHVFGWGVNLGADLDLTERDSLQLLGVYGYGVGGLGNDTSFLNSDAGFKLNGSLEALPYWSAMGGFTHRWSDKWRSTISYGYVNLQPASGQSPAFYNFSHYASANVVWQIRKQFSVGFEALYGFMEGANGVNSDNHWRLQLGLLYWLFP
jgi:hypothetical protein